MKGSSSGTRLVVEEPNEVTDIDPDPRLSQSLDIGFGQFAASKDPKTGGSLVQRKTTISDIEDFERYARGEDDIDSGGNNEVARGGVYTDDVDGESGDGFCQE